jgi:hypothetical protein
MSVLTEWEIATLANAYDELRAERVLVPERDRVAGRFPTGPAATCGLSGHALSTP